MPGSFDGQPARFANERTLMSFDWAFKTMLRDKANAVVLEGLLSALLRDDIVIEEILESEGNQQRPEEKFNRVDLFVRDSKGQHIIVEIQNNRQLGYLQRLLFGTSRVIVDHMNTGQPYTDVVKVISVSIVYFPLGEGKDYLYHGTTEFRGMNHRNDVLTMNEKEQLAIEPGIYHKNIFPEYYLICLDRYDKKLHEDVDEWIYMLKYSEIRKEFNSKHIQQAGEKLRLMNMTQQEYRAYQNYMGELAEVQDEFQTVKLEGMKEGIEVGRQEGLKQARFEIARGLLGEMAVRQVATKTGLSEEKVSSLKD